MEDHVTKIEETAFSLTNFVTFPILAVYLWVMGYATLPHA
jgi:hypothetical protein